MFLAALQIAGPLIAVLFLTDVAFGLLNRVAPALNAFQLGFPAKILLVLTLSGPAITMLPQVIETLVDRAVTAVLKLQPAVERAEVSHAPARRPNNRPNRSSRRPSGKARSAAARTSAPGSACWPPASCCPATLGSAMDHAQDLMDEVPGRSIADPDAGRGAPACSRRR